MASVSKNWNPELSALEQQLLAQDALDRAYTDELRSQDVNYKSASNEEDNISAMASAWGVGVFVKHLNTGNNSGYPLVYGSSLASVSSSGYGFEFCYNRLDRDRLYYRGGANSNWTLWNLIYHSGNYARPEDRTAGEVGTYAHAKVNKRLIYGDTVSGSLLSPSSASGIYYQTGGLSGTWRCMGRTETYSGGGAINDNNSLFLRIA